MADNLALGKTCSQSSTYGGNTCDRAVDGSMATSQWTTGGSGEWWKVDLGGIYVISEIQLEKAPGFGSYPKYYYIQTADDWAFTTNVTNIITVNNDSSEFNSWDTNDFGSVSTRYLRVLTHTVAELIIIAEFRVYQGNVEISSDPIVISSNIFGNIDLEFVGFPINIDVGFNINGKFVEGVKLSTSSLIELYFQFENTKWRRMIFTDWKRYKGEGLWNFAEQEDKFGYLNNPNWSEDNDTQDFLETIGLPTGENSRHIPCGHWHKIPPEIYGLDQRTKIVELIDTYEFAPETTLSVLIDKSIINTIHDGIVAVFYRDSISLNFILKTVAIGSDGMITGTIDTLTIVDNQNNQGCTKIMHVANSIYALCYLADDISSDIPTIKTYSISSDGIISSMIDSYTLDKGYNYADWCHVHDNIYIYCNMKFSTLLGVATSFWIDNDGSITGELDSVIFQSESNNSYLNRISKTHQDSTTVVIASAYYDVDDDIMLKLINCTNTGNLKLIDSHQISLGVDLTQQNIVDVGTQGKVGIIFRTTTLTNYFRLYDISSNAFGSYIGTSEIDFGVASSIIDNGILHWINDYWILNYRSGGAGQQSAGLLRYFNNKLNLTVFDNVNIQATGLNASFGVWCKVWNNDDIAVIAFTGDDSDGWIATIRMEDYYSRISGFTSPITEEPQIWPI